MRVFYLKAYPKTWFRYGLCLLNRRFSDRLVGAGKWFLTCTSVEVALDGRLLFCYNIENHIVIESKTIYPPLHTVFTQKTTLVNSKTGRCRQRKL